jgi:hypothetical protein
VIQRSLPDNRAKDGPLKGCSMADILDFVKHKEKIDRENQLNDDSRLMPYIFANKSDEDFQSDYDELHDIELDKPKG